MSYTLAQIHFVKGVINHRIRFGTPERITKLDKYRSLAVFSLGSVFGYIRWRANEYGTQDWRVYVLKAQTTGYISDVIGITPAVKILVSVQGKPAVKRCLIALDKLEKQAGGNLDTIPESYWPRFSNALLLRKAPRDVSLSGALHAR